MRRPRSKLAAVVLRRGWLVVVVTIAVAALASVAGDRGPTRFTVESLVVVPAGESAEGPGNAIQATQLAQTYVETIPEDGGALVAVAGAVKRGVDAVAEDVEVIGDPETSLLRLRYEDTDRARALVGGRVLFQAVIGSDPAARSVAPGSLRIVRQPRVTTTTSASAGAAVPIGIFLGLCLGIALVVTWERSDPRIDAPRELAGEAVTPATALHDVKPGNVGALIERWSRAAGAAGDNGAGPPARSVALLAATRGSEGSVDAAAARLAELSADGGHPLVLRNDTRAKVNGDGHLVLATGGVPGGPSAGEALAAQAAVVVLAVAPGARATELRATLALLEQFGVRPAWVLFVRR